MCGCGDKNMDNVKKVVVKSKSRSLDSILDEVLGDLDGMVDGSVKDRILGMKEAEQAPEDMVSEEGVEVLDTGHAEPDGDEIPEELRAKLMELLSQ